jgi:hypothetical protein
VIKIIKSDTCPDCDALYKKMVEAGHDFDAFDGNTPEGMSELALTGMNPAAVRLPLVVVHSAIEYKLMVEIMDGEFEGTIRDISGSRN